MSSTDGDPEWRMEAVDWNPVEMVAREKESGSGAGAGSAGSKKRPAPPGKSAARNANYRCQVEGCPAQLLPLRSYYQRQHICEEHFRALAITDASGRVTRFCQQCTKLEPMGSFDGERRSCRISLERRNQRRQGKRVAASAASGRTRGGGSRKKAPASAGASAGSTAPNSNSSGSGSGSVTRVNGGSGDSGPAGGRFTMQHSLSADEGAQGLVLGSGGQAWRLPGGAANACAPLPGAAGGSVGALAGYWVQQVDAASPWAGPVGLTNSQAAALSDGSAFPGPPSPDLPTHRPGAAAFPAPHLDSLTGLPGQPQQYGTGAGSTYGGTAALHMVKQEPHSLYHPGYAQPQPPYEQGSNNHSLNSLGGPVAEPQLSVIGSAQLGALSALEMDRLLALDADSLADAILQGTAPPRPSPPPLDSISAPGSGQPAALPSLAALEAARQWPAHGVPAGLPPTQLAQQRPRAWHAAFLAANGGVDASQPLYHAGMEQGAATSYASLAPPAVQPSVLPAAPMELTAQERRFAAQLLGEAAWDTVPGLAPGGGSWREDVRGWEEAELGEADIDALLLPGEPVGVVDEARICIKLYGVRPDQLPAQLRSDLLAALSLPNTAVQASMRSGCVHLTVTALLTAEERARLAVPGAAAAAAARLLPLARQLPSRRLLMQVGGSDSAALLAQPVGSDSPAVLLSLPADAAAAPPAPLPAGPLAATVSEASGQFLLRVPRALLSRAGMLALHCRSGGMHCTVALKAAGAEDVLPPEEADEETLSDSEAAAPMDDTAGDEAATDEEESMATTAPLPNGVIPAAGADHVDLEAEWVEVEAFVAAAVPRAAAGTSGEGASWQSGWGLYEFEIARGALVGGALPLLLLPDSAAAAAAELARLRPSAHSATMLRLAAAVLRFLEARQRVEKATGSSEGDGAAFSHLQAQFHLQYPPLAVARIAAAARKLLDIAEICRWPAVAALLLPAAGADGWRPQPAPTTAPPAPAATANAAPETAAPQLKGACPSSGEPYPSVGKAAALASSSAEPLKPHKQVGGGAGAVPELSFKDERRRTMHPAVLGAATVLVAGVVLGVGAALVSGHLA